MIGPFDKEVLRWVGVLLLPSTHDIVSKVRVDKPKAGSVSVGRALSKLEDAGLIVNIGDKRSAWKVA